METDEDICIQWSTADLVLAVMEAVKQTGCVAVHKHCIHDVVSNQ